MPESSNTLNEDKLASYLETKIENWDFYVVFSFFRLAAICQGVLKRALDGNASSDAAMLRGKLVQPLAQMGVDTIYF